MLIIIQFNKQEVIHFVQYLQQKVIVNLIYPSEQPLLTIMQISKDNRVLAYLTIFFYLSISIIFWSDKQLVFSQSGHYWLVSLHLHSELYLAFRAN